MFRTGRRAEMSADPLARISQRHGVLRSSQAKGAEGTSEDKGEGLGELVGELLRSLFRQIAAIVALRRYRGMEERSTNVPRPLCEEAARARTFVDHV